MKFDTDIQIKQQGYQSGNKDVKMSSMDINERSDVVKTFGGRSEHSEYTSTAIAMFK